MIEGEGAVHAAAAKSRGLTVQITDETGRPVEGAAVSFRMPEQGPGGTFAHGMRTEIAITTPDGRASMPEINTGSVAGPFQIRVTAVKLQVRAGTVVSQFVSDKAIASKKAPSSRRLKWLLVAGVAAAGAAAGAFATGSGSTPAGVSPAAITLPPAPATQIGIPTITVGKP